MKNTLKQVLQHFLFFTLFFICYGTMVHYAYLFSYMVERFYVAGFLFIIMILLGVVIYKKMSIRVKIILFILLYVFTTLFLNLFSELKEKKELDISIRSSDSNCEEYFRCSEGVEITRGKETFIINKDICLKYDWKWNEKGKYCKIFSSWID